VNINRKSSEKTRLKSPHPTPKTFKCGKKAAPGGNPGRTLGAKSPGRKIGTFMIEKGRLSLPKSDFSAIPTFS
jgi:hypothetical protein